MLFVLSLPKYLWGSQRHKYLHVSLDSHSLTMYSCSTWSYLQVQPIHPNLGEHVQAPLLAASRIDSGTSHRRMFDNRAFHVGADWVLLWPLLPSRTWTTSWYGVVSGAMIVYILSSQNTWSARTTERTCHKLPAKEKDVNLLHFNPLTPMCDQDRISPYNINTISIR